MISCPLCQGLCKGHAGRPAQDKDCLLEFADSDVFSRSTIRSGMQPKEMARIENEMWIIKHDRMNVAHASLNEWMSMQLMRCMDFECAEYGLSWLEHEDTKRAALSVKYFDLLNDSKKQLVSGLQVLRESPDFACRVETLMESTDPEEFEVVYESEMISLTLFEAVEIMKNAGVTEMSDVFKFYVAADLLNHTDCHLGNVGFIRDLETGAFEVSPVYDVGNFGVYSDVRTILPTSSVAADFNHAEIEKFAKLCGVADWENVVLDMAANIRSTLPLVCGSVRNTPWLKDIKLPPSATLRGPVDLDTFLVSYQETIDKSVDSFLSQTVGKTQFLKFGGFGAENAGGIIDSDRNDSSTAFSHEVALNGIQLAQHLKKDRKSGAR